MSRNLVSKEEAINQLYAAIKTKFQQDGVLREIRCLLQAKMIAMMKGNSDKDTLVQRPHTSPSDVDFTGDARMMLLHQLIMEYLHWHGYHYTAQMFSQESACANDKVMRQDLAALLGHFEHKSLPILLQMFVGHMEQHHVATERK